MKIIDQHGFLLNHKIVLFLCLFGMVSCRHETKEFSASVPDEWYRNSIVYNLDVDVFNDSDGDGIGDFKGLAEKLSYLDSLGIEVLWLSPFQPTPDKDDGYDVSDYYGIDPRLGTMADFDGFISEAKKHNIKIIMDMVLNHTSIEHPWYKKARSDSSVKYRSRYVWSKTKPRDFDEGMVFEGFQSETWSYDEVAGRYYFHRFYDFQPDLNYRNREVQQEAIKILRFWSAKGIKGFRLDAVPFIIDVPESGAAKPAKMFGVLDSIVRGAKSIDNQTLLLGEANVEPKENIDYFGEKGERLQMMFNFYVNQYLFYSMATGKTGTLIRALNETRLKPPHSQWAYFLRNHDEIDLGRLSKSQRNKVYEKFGPEANMQLYKRGIRRRLAPMLHNPERIKMAYSILYSLPGAPVIRSGEEIGMGDDLTLAERLSVRTPMQWNSMENAGFSTAQKTFRPVVSMGEYAYQKVNVASQLSDKESLLNFIKLLISVRKSLPELGVSDWQVLDLGNDAVLAIAYKTPSGKITIIHNFGDKATEVTLPLTGKQKVLVGSWQAGENGRLKMEPYGRLWLKG
ncbi:maltose alpha-D-glucosyltransferase/alpha-amylase [Pedobacter sp. W3I1]|uniref:alpha-amylase family protein n=1 Tax=Pedobacter sp. W3I1 TaxID=3042291 RepID=UPI002789FFB1|nr:alpha-amylase family protein [Pedobacter sp. W3I1]MDQ0641192.1 maltose alpha-D-glucosyltransferase/alpha-amylase [Pedobacter sp. W3I1]